MKMITKTFYKPMYAMRPDVDFLVTAKLKEGMTFVFDYPDSEVMRGKAMQAQGKTPKTLWMAWALGESSTFSVTLPAKYWK